MGFSRSWLWLGDKATVVPGVKIKVPPALVPAQAPAVVTLATNLSNVSSSENIANSVSVVIPTVN